MTLKVNHSVITGAAPNPDVLVDGVAWDADHVVIGSVETTQMPALTGDVTTSAGDVNTTISANVVTNAKLATMPATTIKGNSTSGTANASDLTGDAVEQMLLFTQSGTGAVQRSLDSRIKEVISVKDFGAKGDMRVTSDAAISSGSPNLTSATAAFTSADVGKSVRVGGAGAAGADLYTTVLTYTSSTAVVLAASASFTVSGAAFRIATDDTTAIQNALAQASFRTLFFPKGAYLVEKLTGDEIFLVQKATRFQGEIGGYEGSWIAVSKRTPSTIDHFHIKPNQTSVPFIEFRGLCIATEVPDGYTGGKNAIHVETDGSSQMQRLVISDCWINGGSQWGIITEDTNVGTSTATFYQSVITRNVIRGTSGAIGLTNCGDSDTISDNAFSGLGRGIYITPVSGAACQVIERNGFQNMQLGAIFLDGCVQAKILNNQIEQGATYLGPENAMVAINNCHEVEISGNNLNGFNFVAPLKLYGGTTNTKVTKNVFNVTSGAGFNHIEIPSGAGASNVIDGTNVFKVSNVVAAELINDASGVYQRILGRNIIESTVLVGSAVALTNATNADITSISLPAGDWDVWGTVVTSPNAATTQSAIYGWVSTTSATVPTVPNGGAIASITATMATGASIIMPVGKMRISLTSTTTVYLSIRVNFAVNTNAAYGYIGARRVDW